jgi:hypothetical protein
MVIEDFPPVPGVEIEVDIPEKVKKVNQIPDGKKMISHGTVTNSSEKC